MINPVHPSFKAILLIIISFAASFLFACNDANQQNHSDTVYCDSAIRLLKPSALFFSQVYDKSFLNTNYFVDPEIRVKYSNDTTIDFTSFKDSILYLDTANILKYRQYDPTYATLKEIQDFKNRSIMEGRQRKIDVANRTIRYIIVNNNTPNNLKFLTTEFLLIALIEVKIDEKHWNPIQYFQPYPNTKRVYNYNLELKPMQNFIVVDTMKYTGDTTVKARYKFLTNIGFVCSNEFSINLDKCLAHGISKKTIDSLSRYGIYFLDTVVNQ